MSSKSLSERINIKKVVLILWSLYIFVFLAILLGDVGEILLSGNLVWDEMLDDLNEYNKKNPKEL
jgi:hypothetical protein